MKIEEQNALLLKILNRIYLELGVYRTFVEFGRLSIGNESLERILGEARQDPSLRQHVDAYCQGIEASLRLSDDIDPNQVLREFLSLLDSREKAN